MSLDILPGSNLETPCTALSDGPERVDIVAYKSNIPSARGRNTIRGCRTGEEETACNNSPRAGTRVSYRFLRADRTGIGQLACGQPLCPQRSVGRASPATVLTPSPNVLGQYRRPQSPRCPWTPCESSAFQHIPDYLPLLLFFHCGSNHDHIAHRPRYLAF